MKASELRIGNLYDENGIPKQVTPNTIEELFISERKWIEPIPLTEEWLLKFGFEYETLFDSDGGEFYQYTKGIVKVYNSEYNSDWQMDISEDGVVYLEYVHQLQNLVHALTNEELTLKQN